MVLVVKPRPEMIAIADRVVGLGAGAGTAGGTVCLEVMSANCGLGTITGRHLDDRLAIEETVCSSSGTVEVRGESTHNRQGSSLVEGFS